MRNILKVVIIAIIVAGITLTGRFIVEKRTKTSETNHLATANRRPLSLENKIPLENGISSVKQNVILFFGNNQKDPSSCVQVYPVQRVIDVKESDLLTATLEELLKGPTDKDGSMGYYSSIPPGVKIQKVLMRNGSLRVDFDETLERGVSGFCRVATIRSQLNQTLQQFPDVKNVVISIDDRTEGILQPQSSFQL